MDDSDLSFASILLGFRKKDDKPQVDLENAATAKVTDDSYAPPRTPLTLFLMINHVSI